MIRNVGLSILIAIFLIIGLAAAGTEQVIHNELADIPEQDLDVENLDNEIDEKEKQLAPTLGPSRGTRAIEENLNNIEWEKLSQDRNNGLYPIHTIKCADLNNDGLTDILEGTFNYVWASLQNSDGSWSNMNQGLQGSPVAGNPYVDCIDVGDINNDGWLDIISMNYSYNNFFKPDIYFNNQGINWTRQNNNVFENTNNSRAVILEDFNNDNILDLAYCGYRTGNNAETKLVIYIQQPIGTWTFAKKFDSLNLVYWNCIDSFDYDNDGDMDLTVGGGGNDLYIFTNINGTGYNWSQQLLEPSAAKSHIISVKCGDLNHDGYQDIAYCVYESADRNLLIHSYNGTGWKGKIGNLPYFGEYVDISIADINLDGHQDISASGSGGTDIFLGNGKFNWTLANKGLSSGSYCNFVEDIDNDGVMDVVDMDGIYKTKGLENLFVKGFEKITSNLPSGKKFALDYGDANKDGWLDLLAVRNSGTNSNNVNVYYNNCDGTWTKYGAPFCAVTSLQDAKFGDMDNDGDLDIIFCSQNWNRNIMLVRNSGNGTYPDPYENLFSYANGRAYIVDLGDYDYDGDLDILAGGYESGAGVYSREIWIIENDNGTWVNQTIYKSSNYIYDLKFVNINNDLYLDIVASGINGFGVKAFLYNFTNSSWDEHSTGLVTTSSWGVDCRDIDNNGVTELVSYLRLYSWNETGDKWDYIDYLGGDTKKNHFIDLNFDGFEDIMQIQNSGGYTIWTNKGEDGFQKGVYQNPTDETFQEFVAFDSDWDGTKELFFSHLDIGIRVYELKIKQDKTEIEFSNQTPSGSTWLDSVTVSPSVLISDTSGSGVDGANIEYAIKKHSDIGFGSWNSYTPQPLDAQDIEASIKNLIFEEGDQNYIKWRAKDVVGNGYTESPEYQIKIDVSNPYFQNENPPNDKWVKSQSQTLSVQITDDWSGLDAPSIKYKLDTGSGYGVWVSAGQVTDGNTLVPSTIAYLSEGRNKIIWAATDNVGHYVQSAEYIIKLDTQPTVFKSPNPQEGEWMTTKSFKCSVNIFDSGINGSGVNSSAIQFRYSTNGIFDYGTWTDGTDLYQIEDGQNIGVHVNTSLITFLEGTNNYVQFQALDKATNGYTSSPDYKIMVDTTEVTFTNPKPGANDWQASNEVRCYITIEDILGSGVDGTSAEYWVVTNNPDPENATANWTKAGTQASGKSVTFDSMIDLPQGVHNYIKWRAKDVAGNGFTESEWYQVKVDSTGIQYSGSYPLSDKWQKSTAVSALIVVNIDTDPEHLDYSNPQSVQYRYSTTGVTNFGPWNTVDSYKIIDSTTLVVIGSLNLIDGTENYVQWRAKENVSEGYTLSSQYQIKVDTIPVTISNPKPTPNDWQSSVEVECFITIEDIGGSGTDGASAEYWVVEDNSNPMSESPNWTKALTQVSGESVTFSTKIDLPDSIYNWILWRAKDVAGNGWTYSNWNQIKVDTSTIQFSNPNPTSEQWQTTTLVNSSIIITIDTNPEYLDYSNNQSLQYRVSTTGILGFGSWQMVDKYIIIDNDTLQCEAALSLTDGTDNYIQWRALENVTKGIYFVSTPYQIKVDSQALTYTNPVPTSNTINEVLEITCYITIQDSGSTVDGSSIQYRYSTEGSSDSKFSSWTNTVSQPNGQSITVSVILECVNGNTNYIQWLASDLAGIGPVYSGKYQIKVNFVDFDKDGIADDKDYDDDNDGVLDTQDAFPYDDSEWLDTDSDSIGDNADDDDDDDGVLDTLDAFPTNPAEYADSDSDGIGDNSDADDDNDGVPDLQDEFPYNSTEWDDTDGDSIGDNTDPDIDGDGYLNENDVFPTNYDEHSDWDDDGIGDNSDSDDDNDGVPDLQDKFPKDPAEWADTDNDGIGDNTDSDIDGDGYPNEDDEFPTDPDEWLDTDGDGFGDNSDTDIDGDGVPNLQDKFPYNQDEWLDSDGDGLGNNEDQDDDNDGYNDTTDDLPNNANEWEDTDGDGIGDNTDADIDGDGYSNTNDAFENNKFEWLDTDGDGVGDNEDDDNDADGYNDTLDGFPNNPEEWSDFDNDGIGDNSDADKDGDGYPNTNDPFPDDPNEWMDTDKDGIGNNKDDDDDDDGYSDTLDEFPTNSNEWKDTDNDGIGDNADIDDDNDGMPDYDDFAPLDKKVQRDPNLIRIAGVEFEIGELVMGILMAIGAVFLGTFAFTRKKRLYNKYKHRIQETSTVKDLNEVNDNIKGDMEREKLTNIQLTMLKDQYDEKYMELRKTELDRRMGKLPQKVEISIREVIKDKMITEEEFASMQSMLARLRDSKSFNSEKKAKLQGVLKDWINENVPEDREAPVKGKRKN